MKKAVLYLIFLIILIPSHVFAESYTSYYNSIEKEMSFDVGDLSISSLWFVDNSSKESQMFGLIGDVENKSESVKKITVYVDYYTSLKELVVSLKRSWTVSLEKEQRFDLLHSINEIKGERSASEIEYYTIKIEIEDGSNSSKRPSLDSQYIGFKYVIDSYDVVVKVNEDNSYDVTEKITVHYNENGKGLIRKIPLKRNLIDIDGNGYKKRINILKAKIDAKHSITKEDGYYKLKIDEEVLEGTHDYVLNYSFSVSKDDSEYSDLLNFDIIDYSWDTVIGGIKFRIDLPKSFDSKKIYFLNSRDHLENRETLNYERIGNVIVGTYNDVLAPKEGLTLGIELEDGYFLQTKFNAEMYTAIMFIVPLISMVISFMLWFIYGKDDEVDDAIMAYPPKSLNSLEAGYFYKGYIDKEDVLSLILYLASKGYIKIVEIDDSKHKKIKLVKLKDYDGHDSFERRVMDSLFVRERTHILDDNKEDIDGVVRSIIRILNSPKNRKKIFYEGDSYRKAIICLLMAITTIVLLVTPLYRFGTMNDLFPALLFIGLYVPAIYLLFSNKTSLLAKIVFGLVVVIQFGTFLTLNETIYDSLFVDGNYSRPLIFGIVSLLVMAVCIKEMPKRTKYGNMIFGKVKGFKRFLESVSKDELDKLIKENPVYIYDMIPYTVTFGITDEWLKNYNDNLPFEPDWFQVSGKCDIQVFKLFLERFLKIIK